MDLGRNKVISRASKFKNHEVISLKNVNDINFINILTFHRKLSNCRSEALSGNT